MDRRRGHGRALILLGLLALARRGCPAGGPLPAAAAGEPVPVELEALRGEGFRLLPGVGPVLGARLEQARRAAGGTLDEAAAARVRGVGPSLLSRWRALRTR